MHAYVFMHVPNAFTYALLTRSGACSLTSACTLTTVHSCAVLVPVLQGTYEYMAPELKEAHMYPDEPGLPPITFKTDVYRCDAQNCMRACTLGACQLHVHATLLPCHHANQSYHDGQQKPAPNRTCAHAQLWARSVGHRDGRRTRSATGRAREHGGSSASTQARLHCGSLGFGCNVEGVCTRMRSKRVGFCRSRACSAATINVMSAQ